MASETDLALRCAWCGQEIEEEPVQKGPLAFCSEPCAFEITRSVCPADCHCRVVEKPPLKA